MPKRISVTALANKLRSVQTKIKKLAPIHMKADKAVMVCQQKYLKVHSDAAHRQLISCINKQHAIHKKLNSLEMEEATLIDILRSLQG